MQVLTLSCRGQVEQSLATGRGMLYRMFTRWAGKKGYGTEVLDYLDGDEAGIKSVTVKITGMNAYGYLRSEKVFTVLSEFLHSMQQENDRHRLHPVM